MPESMFTPAYERLVEVVVEIRQRAGLTQRQLAEKLGREQSYVGRIETRQRRLDLVEFVWICRACGADPEKEAGRVIRGIKRHV
jgi:transcriptional regulator with XRE-family HTH domain